MLFPFPFFASCWLYIFFSLFLFCSSLLFLPSCPLLSFCVTSTAPPGGSICRWSYFSLWFVSRLDERNASLLQNITFKSFKSSFCFHVLCFAHNVFHRLSSLLGRAHMFRPQVLKSYARPSSPSPFSTDAPPLAKSHPSISESGNQCQKYGNSFYSPLLIFSHHLPASSNLSYIPLHLIFPVLPLCFPQVLRGRG